MIIPLTNELFFLGIPITKVIGYYLHYTCVNNDQIVRSVVWPIVKGFIYAVDTNVISALSKQNSLSYNFATAEE